MFLPDINEEEFTEKPCVKHSDSNLDTSNNYLYGTTILTHFNNGFQQMVDDGIVFYSEYADINKENISGNDKFTDKQKLLKRKCFSMHIPIQIINSSMIHLNTVTGDFFVNLNIENINVFQLKFSNTITITHNLLGFTIAGNSSGTKALVGYSSSGATLENDNWQKLFTITSGLTNLKLIMDDFLLFSSGNENIKNDGIQFASESYDP